jgi:putative transposase
MLPQACAQIQTRFRQELRGQSRAMRVLLNLTTALLRCTLAFFRSQGEQAMVELALRQQLAIYAQNKTKPKLTPLDRTFWVALFRFWPRWRDTLVIVKPDTVVRWRRKGFRLYWRTISKRGPRRPPISEELKVLIFRLASENDWRARKIHAELKKLGFSVGLATVSRYLPKRPPDPGKQQRWLTFLRNHRDGIAAMDFFVVPTVGFRLLYVWFMIDHGREAAVLPKRLRLRRPRRRIVHFGVTASPTSQWVIQHLREACPYDFAPDYLIYDNDSIFSRDVTRAIEHLGAKPKRIAFQSPWQNGIAERWVGSCKREIIDHVIVFNEDHLRQLLREYVSYYNTERVHTRLQDSPEGRPVESRPSSAAKVVGLPRVGGLHHRYVWKAAA